MVSRILILVIIHFLLVCKCKVTIKAEEDIEGPGGGCELPALGAVSRT